MACALSNGYANAICPGERDLPANEVSRKRDAAVPISDSPICDRDSGRGTRFWAKGLA